MRAFGLAITADNAAAVLEFYNGYVPLIRSESRGAHLRTLLARLRKAAPDLEGQVATAIARSDLVDGLPDRARRLHNDPVLHEELTSQISEFEGAYGARLLTDNWGNPSRGASLLYYLQVHAELVVGKDVLHVSPEDETRNWLARVCHYRTLNADPDATTDIAADITKLPIAGSSFDLILCHRVLEHVLDDLQAMREFFRVLRPGGILNLSVPQAVHRPRTAEWLVPDESHDWHLRQYGLDLTERLESVGFDVRPVTWLLERPVDDLLSRNAYPMRLYEARRN